MYERVEYTLLMGFIERVCQLYSLIEFAGGFVSSVSNGEFGHGFMPFPAYVNL